MRNVRMLEEVVEVWEAKEAREDRPLPPQMAATVEKAVSEISVWIQRLTELRDRARTVLARCQAGT